MVDELFGAFVGYDPKGDKKSKRPPSGAAEMARTPGLAMGKRKRPQGPYDPNKPPPEAFIHPTISHKPPGMK